ncbi:MAG: COX15/CtaA family protein [Alphaproteobacteria bacterium]|jgi:cytochrome c oxidase assembly protein subunit 15
MNATTTHGQRRRIAFWLLICCAMVFVMVVLGGVTRLTHSGLSMVEWQPMTGILPPLNEAEWSAAFEKYQQYPEFQKLNSTMDVEDFKSIFWLEFIHRLWGRTIGVVFALPFLWFLFRGAIDRRLAPKLVMMFVLGGLQGLMGWYMVKSGLVDRPDVSQYRLTAHLALAFVVYGYMLWVALGLLFADDETRRCGPHGFAIAVTVMAAVTVLTGGLVAGIDAGFIYNTFPLMGGQLVPVGLFEMEPAAINAFENATMVQFNHRVLAIATALAAVALWLAGRRAGLGGRARLAANTMLTVVALQVALGIATLLSVVAVPLAAAHQAGAMVVFTAMLWLVFETGDRRAP